MVLLIILQERIFGIFGCISGESPEKRTNSVIIVNFVVESGSCTISRTAIGKRQSAQICGTGINKQLKRMWKHQEKEKARESAKKAIEQRTK